MGESFDTRSLAFWSVVDYTIMTYNLSEHQAMLYAMGVVFRKYSKDPERAKA